jgi:hypothetical protein
MISTMTSDPKPRLQTARKAWRWCVGLPKACWTVLKNWLGPPHWHREYEQAIDDVRTYEREDRPALGAAAANVLLDLARENWNHHTALLAQQEERQDSLCKFAGATIATAAASIKAFGVVVNEWFFWAALTWIVALVLGIAAQVVFARYPRPPQSHKFRQAFRDVADKFLPEEIAAGSLHMTCVGLRVNYVRRRAWLAGQYILLGIGFALLACGIR